MLSEIQVKEVEVYYSPCTARTPLKFGAVVVEHLIFARCGLLSTTAVASGPKVGAASL